MQPLTEATGWCLHPLSNSWPKRPLCQSTDIWHFLAPLGFVWWRRISRSFATKFNTHFSIALLVYRKKGEYTNRFKVILQRSQPRFHIYSFAGKLDRKPWFRCYVESRIDTKTGAPVSQILERELVREVQLWRRNGCFELSVVSVSILEADPGRHETRGGLVYLSGPLDIGWDQWNDISDSAEVAGWSVRNFVH